MTVEPYKYKAFLSYSHADEKWASWLHHSLETYRVPKSVAEEHRLTSTRLAPIFRDRDELASSSNLSAVIEDALATSQNLIVICSPNAARSHWVNEEIRRFKQFGRSDRVHCLLIDDPSESFPAAALLDFDRDGVATGEETEPVAADAREESGGKNEAKLKLIAGLLGIGLDRLKQREAQRRYRRFAMITGLSSVGAVAMAVLAVVATLARQEANLNAEAASVQAARAEAVSEFLAETLQAADPVKGDGPSTTIRQILDHASERILDDALASHPQVEADARQTIGEAYLQLGLFERAREHFETLLTLRETSAETSDLEIITALTNLGMLNRRTGDFAEAEQYYRRGLDIAATSYEIGDTGTNSLRNNLGLLLSEQGRLAEAAEFLEQVVEWQRANLPLDSTALATSLNNLALVRRSQGDFERAKSLFEESLAVAKAAWGDEHVHVATLLDSIASIDTSAGRYEQARDLHIEALNLRQRILGERNLDVGRSLNNLGVLHYSMDELDAANEYLMAALDQYTEFLGEQHASVGRVLHTLGLVSTRQARHAEAEASLLRAVEIKVATLGEGHASTLNSYDALATAYVNAEQPAEAEVIARRAVAIGVERGLPDKNLLARLKRSLGASLTLLGKYAEAEPHLLAAFEQHESELGLDHRQTRSDVSAIVELYARWGRDGEADRWRQRLPD